MVRTFLPSSFSPFSLKRRQHRAPPQAPERINSKMPDDHVAPALPPELLECIIDDVGRSNDTQTLRACALVCSTFTLRAQSHLFRSIDLDKRVPRYRFYVRFYTLLASKPHLGTYVRYLRLGDDVDDDYEKTRCGREGAGSSWISNAKTLPQTLGLLPCLQGFSLTFNSDMTDWNDISPQTRLALERVFALPSLQAVSLEFITNFPSQLLSSFARLKHLGLSCVETEATLLPSEHWQGLCSAKLESIFLRGTPPSTVNAISHSLVPSSHPTLQKLSITPTFEPGFCDAVSVLLKSPSASNLSAFEWLPSVHFLSSTGPIDLSPLRNLRSLTFNVSCRPSPRSAFSQTLKLLVQLASRPNAVEEITLETYFLRFPCPAADRGEMSLEQMESLVPPNPSLMEWHALDKLLSRSAFKCLKGVRVNLNCMVGEEARYFQSAFKSFRLLHGVLAKDVSVSVRIISRNDERFPLEGSTQS